MYLKDMFIVKCGILVSLNCSTFTAQKSTYALQGSRYNKTLLLHGWSNSNVRCECIANPILWAWIWYPSAKKNKKGNRLFTSDDVENLKIIFNLVKEKGFTLQGAKDYLYKNKGEVKENQKVIDSLERLKQFLLEVKQQL